MVAVPKSGLPVNLSSYQSDRSPRQLIQQLLGSSETVLPELRQTYASPIFKLPPELVSEIFHYCLPDDEDFVVPSVRTAPLLTGQICSNWRKIALSSPRLWCSIHLQWKRPDYDHAALIRCWLGRSGMCPLSIILNSYVHDSSDCVEVISSFAARWKNISLIAPTSSFRPLLQMSGAGDNLLLLERVFLGFVDHEEELSQKLKLFELAPRLSNFHIWAKNSWFSQAAVSLPWTNLTHMTLVTWISPSECLRTLEQCSKLRICRLTLETEEEFLDCPFIKLPELTTLEVEMDGLGALLDHLTLPALSNLDLYSFDVDPQLGPHRTPLSSLISRSACHLDGLTVDLSSIDEADMLECLPLCPELFSLILSYPHVQVSHDTDILLHALTLSPSGNDQDVLLVPELEFLRMWNCGVVSSNAVNNMFESRRRTEHAVEDRSTEQPLKITGLRDAEICTAWPSSSKKYEIWTYEGLGTVKYNVVDPLGINLL